MPEAAGLPWESIESPPPAVMQPHAAPAPAATPPAAPVQATVPAAPSAPAPQAAAMPSAPDPLAPVMAKISSGESGGDYNARYGFPDLPGAPGPQGESHALGKYQFEPGTWKQAAAAYHAAHPGTPAPSFNNPVDQDRVARGWAIRTYGVDKNGHTLPEAAAAGTVDYARLAGQWPSLAPHSLQAQWGSLTPEEQALQKQRTTETQELQGRLTKQLQDATAYAMSKPEGSKERGAAIADLRRDNAEMMREWREKIMTPPVAHPMDAWQNMGNAGFILAALAGLFSRQHITAGLAAAGNALNAINQNSREEFKRQYDIWKDQVQLGSQMISMENQDIRNLLEDRKMDFDEKQARVGTMFQSLGLESQIGQMGIGNVDRAQQLLSQRDTMLMQFKLAQQKVTEAAIQRGWTYIQGADAKGNPVTVRVNSADPSLGATDLEGNPVPMPKGAVGKMGGASQVLPRQLQFPDKWEGMPNKAPPGVREDVWDTTLYFARTHQMPALGFQPGMRQLVIQAYPAALHALGIQPSESADLTAAYAGERHAAIITGGRAAQLGMAIQEARSFLPMAVEASNKVDRTQYPSLNSIVEAYQRGTGGDEIVRLAVATNALSNAYSQVATRGGQPTDSARATAQHILDLAYSKGQFATAADQMMKEVQAAQAAPGAAWQDIRKSFEPSGAFGSGALSGQGGSYGSPNDVYKAFDDGHLTKDQAKQILIQKFGYTAQ